MARMASTLATAGSRTARRSESRPTVTPHTKQMPSVTPPSSAAPVSTRSSRKSNRSSSGRTAQKAIRLSPRQSRNPTPTQRHSNQSLNIERSLVCDKSTPQGQSVTRSWFCVESEAYCGSE